MYYQGTIIISGQKTRTLFSQSVAVSQSGAVSQHSAVGEPATEWHRPRRLPGLGAVVLFALTALVGCGSGSSDSGNSTPATQLNQTPSLPTAPAGTPAATNEPAGTVDPTPGAGTPGASNPSATSPGETSSPATTNPTATSPPALVTQDIRFTASDGVSLMVKVGGEGSLQPRPLIVEFSPYDPGCCSEYAGGNYNYLQVHIRGTGDSDGSFDALGPRSQQDVVEVMNWACQQPWSNGVAGLYGFSASAIMIYNSLHQKLPACVKSAVLMAGTHELYRDLLYPGGIPNLVAGAYVLLAIGGPAVVVEAPSRLTRPPLTSVLAPTTSMFSLGLNYLAHPALDSWWQERGMRGDVNHLPILMFTSFYDVEPRGPFQAYQELRGDAVHLMVVGAHDGAPVGTESLRGDAQTRWYDHYMRAVSNGIEQEPKVQMLLSDGGRLSYLAGHFVRQNSTDWPVPGTSWASLALDAASSDSHALSLNNGSLSLTPPTQVVSQSYLEALSLPTGSDQQTTAVIGGISYSGYSINTLLTVLPFLGNMSLVEPTGLSYTTKALSSDVLSAGPASLEVQLSSTALETDIYALICDVAPDGTSNPVATGRLRSSFPTIDASKSLHDSKGNIVQPYGVYAAKTMVLPGSKRLYHVEFWPIGNRFQKGHRIRLDLVSVSAYHLAALPALNTIIVGGAQGARLLLPVLPGSDLSAALH